MSLYGTIIAEPPGNWNHNSEVVIKCLVAFESLSRMTKKLLTHEEEKLQNTSKYQIDPQLLHGFDTICNAILQRTQNNMTLKRSRISLPRRLVAAARRLGAHALHAVSVAR